MNKIKIVKSSINPNTYHARQRIWRIIIMATIKQYSNHKGDFWMFTAYLGKDPMTGRDKRTTRRGFKSKRAAKTALDRLINDIQENGFTKKQMPKTYNDVYLLWLDSYRDTVKESTYNITTRLFNNHIIPTFGDLRIEKINALFCQKVVNKWAKTLSTTNQIKTYANVVFKYAVKLEYITRNPMENITVPKKRRQTAKKDDNFYTKQELQAFLSVLDHNKRPFNFFRILAYTGMRKSELLALQWSDVDLDNNQITINKTLARGVSRNIIQSPKTESSNRVISIDYETANILKRWRLVQRSTMLRRGFNTSASNQLLFTSLHNKRLNTTDPFHWLNTIYKDNPKLKQITVHGFRHTCASLMFEAGADVKQVQTRLGHSSVQTTLNIYTHTTAENERKSVDAFIKYMEQ